MPQRILILLTAMVLTGAEPPADDAKKELQRLQGQWQAEKAQRGGKDAPGDVIEKLKVTIDGDKIAIDDGNAREERGQIALDPSRQPRGIDIQPLRPGLEVVKGIYRLDGDTLTLCWAKKGDRPTDFISKADTDLVLLVLKRIDKR